VEHEQIAAAASAYGEVTGVLAAESASGRRTWLVAFAEGAPVDDRTTVREVASLVAMAEVAAELAGEDDVARVASPAYLDKFGTADLGAATPIVEAFVDDVARGYKLPLR
jgi:hypothetical protein